MSARLKDRLRQIPYGFKFPIPALKWEPHPFSSFETIVRGVIDVRRANPYLTKKNNWSTDANEVAQEVDAYNAALCEAHGWRDFIVDGGPSTPKTQPPQQSRAGKLVAGAVVIKDMFGPAGPTNPAQAEARAAVCAECPMNEQGRDWTSFFTVHTSNMVRKALGFLKDLNLQTQYDPALNICSICLCPLRTKVWARSEHILKQLREDDRKDLPPHCWILKEWQAAQPVPSAPKTTAV